MTIVQSVSTARYRTRSRVVSLIVMVWLVTLAVNTPVLATYRTLTDQLTGTFHCVSTSQLASKRLFATFFAFAYLIPLTIIAVCSVGILHHIAVNYIIFTLFRNKITP